MAVGDAHRGQLFGILHRNGAKADGVDELKNGGIGADPEASVTTAITVNPGLRTSIRRPYRRSFHSEAIATSRQY